MLSCRCPIKNFMDVKLIEEYPVEQPVLLLLNKNNQSISTFIDKFITYNTNNIVKDLIIILKGIILYLPK